MNALRGRLPPFTLPPVLIFPQRPPVTKLELWPHFAISQVVRLSIDGATFYEVPCAGAGTLLDWPGGECPACGERFEDPELASPVS